MSPSRVTPEQVLGRLAAPVYSDNTKAFINGRRVLITGAGGSIGSELARQVARLNPGALFLLDRDETLLQNVQFDIWGDGLLHSDNLILVDIRDRKYLNRIIAEVKPDIVFHAAALKHLPLLERHPVEAVKTNIFGTRNVLNASYSAGATTFVNVSTDKAADPTSVLGASKRVAEMVVGSYETRMKLANVRFGNVLGSRGSFFDLIEKYLQSGEPVTVTHPDMERFFMTIPEAAGLVIEAGALAAGNTFVLDMGTPVKITDLVDQYARHAGVATPDIVYTGLRPGEKLSEVVFNEKEKREQTAHPRIWETDGATLSGYQMPALDALEQAVFGASTENDGSVVRILAELVPEYVPSDLAADDLDYPTIAVPAF